MVTFTPVLFVYVSVMAKSLADERAVPAGTFVASLEATEYVYVSSVPETKTSKSRFKATSLQIVAV